MTRNYDLGIQELIHNCRLMSQLSVNARTNFQQTNNRFCNTFIVQLLVDIDWTPNNSTYDRITLA